MEEFRVVSPGGRRADHVTGHAEELLTSMCKAGLLQYVHVDRREERFDVALRAHRVVIRWPVPPAPALLRCRYTQKREALAPS